MVGSGTEVMERFGAEHMRTGRPIVYTSADSVFQILAHEHVIPIEEQYAICRAAYELVVEGMGVGRVIARPFVGLPGAFKRTANRHDFAAPPPAETLLDRLVAAGVPVHAVGKIHDLFAGRGTSTTQPTASDDEGMDAIEALVDGADRGLVFANLVDFDTLYGHRNDVAGYARNLERFDARLAELLPRLRPDDLLIVTADHGNDPTTPSTDHSREHVPVLVLGAGSRPVPLGDRATFADLGQTLAERLRRDAARAWHELLPGAVGMTIREQLEARERTELAPQAMKSADSQGRPRPEPEDPIRPAFQRDRDRIVHCKAFRRLKHKTQVFFSPAGDHYRTRLTHTLEVSQIARTIAKVLRLHEELTEAIALGHDLGHTPFGHAGERVLDSLVPGGFNHYEQSLRVVDVLEGDGRGGLNLSWEVRNGIAKHSKGKHGLPVGSPPEHRSATVEGQIARVADIIAYVNHDIDDAVRAGVLRPEDLPAGPVAILGQSSSQRIGRMVTDVVVQTLAVDVSEIRMSDDVLGAMLALRDFLFSAVYENDVATAEFKKASGILGGLWEKVRERPEAFLDTATIEAEGLDAATRDFVAGMTDRYAVRLFEKLFIPAPWVEHRA